jgi:hypothetical protein
MVIPEVLYRKTSSGHYSLPELTTERVTILEHPGAIFNYVSDNSVKNPL